MPTSPTREATARGVAVSCERSSLVPFEIDDEEPVGEAPRCLDLFERIDILAGNRDFDRVSRGNTLQYREVAVGGSTFASGLNIDTQVRDQMFGPRRAVMESYAVVDGSNFGSSVQNRSVRGRPPRRMLEEIGQSIEVPGVEEAGIAVDEGGDVRKIRHCQEGVPQPTWQRLRLREEP